MMKLKMLIIGVVLMIYSLASAQNAEYRLNETLYVWEMHGVQMIDHPSKPDPIKSRYYYGLPARVVDIEPFKYQASVEVNDGYEMQGHWVRVIIQQDTGYVFDGYLGKLKPFDLRSNAQGIDLVMANYEGTAQVSKEVRSFSLQEGLENGESRESSFYNGIEWNIRNVNPCVVEKYTIPTRRFSEAYQFMMAVYSNYFDQEVNFMAEPEFLRMSGNRTDFFLRGKEKNKQISLYREGNAFVINSFLCSD
ncbi:MAG TPA: hypothetical protein VKZ56_02680 [Membranihabitans sp.]|nr:hypothetical protein [Membranihabitans sp.]